MSLNPSVFKSYDIRGVYPKELDENTAYQIGLAFAQLVKEDLGDKKIIVGRDIRLSGENLKNSLIDGLTDYGFDVLDIGLVGTDMFYHACGFMELPGITVTASHNPAEYNGFKLVKKMPDLVSGEKIRDKAFSVLKPEGVKKGKTETFEIKDSYKKKILSIPDSSKFPSKFKIVVDPANGMGGPAFDLVYSDFPFEIVRIFFDPDGSFPNHGGDPMKRENREVLSKTVLDEKADIGFAFDTDADRFFAIDEEGEYVPSDYLGALMGKYLIEKNGSGTIVCDAICGWAVRDLVSSCGGKTEISQVGHVNIKAKMGEFGAIFGMEKSGHYYLPGFYQAESAVGFSLLVLEMLGFYGKTLSEMVSPLRNKYLMIEQENYEVKNPDEVLDRIKDKFSKDCEIVEIDGVSVISENWHANIRKSNTEPLVRLNIEVLDDNSLLREKQEEFVGLIY